MVICEKLLRISLLVEKSGLKVVQNYYRLIVARDIQIADPYRRQNSQCNQWFKTEKKPWRWTLQRQFDGMLMRILMAMILLCCAVKAVGCVRVLIHRDVLIHSRVLNDIILGSGGLLTELAGLMHHFT